VQEFVQVVSLERNNEGDRRRSATARLPRYQGLCDLRFLEFHDAAGPLQGDRRLFEHAQYLGLQIPVDLKRFKRKRMTTGLSIPSARASACLKKSDGRRLADEAARRPLRMGLQTRPAKEVTAVGHVNVHLLDVRLRAAVVAVDPEHFRRERRLQFEFCRFAVSTDDLIHLVTEGHRIAAFSRRSRGPGQPGETNPDYFLLFVHRTFVERVVTFPAYGSDEVAPIHRRRFHPGKVEPSFIG
jgi:hypothetical protein